ncbi:aspartic proteinase-like protein 2-like, partial [Trifolium medium]|nr:aspartic proteinase-like protein 2-like [Trifolium medium]
YMSDRLHFYTISEGVVTKNSSAPIIFGCSNYRSGYLSKSEKALDGIIGFGHQDISVISQLSTQGVTPRVFSHCLRGDIAGGGTLVMGEIVEADIVYTPLDLS